MSINTELIGFYEAKRSKIPMQRPRYLNWIIQKKLKEERIFSNRFYRWRRKKYAINKKNPIYENLL